MTVYMRIILVIIWSILLTACSTGARQGPAATDTTSRPVPLSAGSYAYYRDGDTIIFNIKVLDKTISGNLYYHFREKDRNTGTVDAKLQQDSFIFGLYRFMSEGIVSYREIAFLIRDGQLLEGTGPQANKGDTSIFQHPDVLDYTTAPVLQKQ